MVSVGSNVGPPTDGPLQSIAGQRGSAEYVVMRRAQILAIAYEEDRLLHGEFLNAALDDASAERDDTRLMLQVQIGATDAMSIAYHLDGSAE